MREELTGLGWGEFFSVDTVTTKDISMAAVYPHASTLPLSSAAASITRRILISSTQADATPVVYGKGLVQIQDATHKCLNVSSQGQRQRQTKKLMLTPEVWQYIKSQFKDLVEVLQYDTQSIKQVVYNGAKRKLISVKQTTELLRFESVQQLDAFADTFGLACVLGIRRRRPRKGVTEHLKESEIFNVVSGSDVTTHARAHRSYEDGIDLAFNGKILTVVVRYSKYIYRMNNATMEVDGCPMNLLSIVIGHAVNKQSSSDDNSSIANAEDHVFVGAVFEDTERSIVVRVAKINRPSIRCAIMQPRSRVGEFVTYGDEAFVINMIANYN